MALRTLDGGVVAVSGVRMRLSADMRSGSGGGPVGCSGTRHMIGNGKWTDHMQCGALHTYPGCRALRRRTTLRGGEYHVASQPRALYMTTV